LGSTGEKVSAIGIGGWQLALKKVDESLIRNGIVAARLSYLVSKATL
jgi:aryl-alcohol dehydrogenase-like predicted oxidoreductase